MTARRASTSPNNRIDPVLYDTETAAPLALKYPAGQLMIAIPAHRALILQAAITANTRIFIVRNATRLLVYFTLDGMESSVPEVEPIEFFETFQRLQIEAMQNKQSHTDATSI